MRSTSVRHLSSVSTNFPVVSLSFLNFFTDPIFKVLWIKVPESQYLLSNEYRNWNLLVIFSIKVQRDTYTKILHYNSQFSEGSFHFPGPLCVQSTVVRPDESNFTLLMLLSSFVYSVGLLTREVLGPAYRTGWLPWRLLSKV